MLVMAVLCILVIGACAPTAERSAQGPHAGGVARDSLMGVVRDSLTDGPLAGSQLFLADDTILPFGKPARWRVVSDAAGRFVFRAVPSGSYVLHARYIGFRARWLRVPVPQPSGALVLRLQPTTIRLGWWPPDSAQVARNRERMPEWTCQNADPDAIEALRKGWIGDLSSREPADWDSLLVAAGLTRDSSEISRLARHVTDPEICRRAGQAYDQTIGATDIHFLVVEVGPVLIVVDGAGDATVLLDHDYRVLTMLVVP